MNAQLPPTTSPLAAAVAARKLQVFPVSVKLDTKTKKYKKTPAIPKGENWQTYQANEKEFKRTKNIGIVVPEGILIIDLDRYKGVTTEDVDRLLGVALDWAGALIQRTISGGEHYAFSLPPGVVLPQGTNLLGKEGFDIRNAGGGWIASGEGYENPTLWGILAELAEGEFPLLPALAIEALRGQDATKSLAGEALDADLSIACANQPKEDISAAEVDHWLNGLDPAPLAYDEWITTGMGTYHQFGGCKETGLSRFEKWSKKDPIRWQEGECAKRWASFNNDKPNPKTFGSVIKLAKAQGVPDFKAESYSLVDGNTAEGKPLHPLLKFVTLGDTLIPPEMVVPGYVQHGVVLIAGSQGVGKTSCLLPLAMTVAGFHPALDPLAPKHWRYVIYITEDIGQAQRVMTGMADHDPDLEVDKAQLRERFMLVDAVRMSVEEVAQVGQIYRDRFTRNVDGQELLPLVVFDTKSALLELDNENDNAEASKQMATLKQGFAGLPLWIIGHVAKAIIGRSDLAALSMRGATAFEADAHQTMFLVQEPNGSRFLILGKKRFEPAGFELEVSVKRAEVVATDRFGDEQNVKMLWGKLAPPALTKAERKETAQRKKESAEANELMADISQLVGTLSKELARPIAKAEVAEAVGGNRNRIFKCIKQMLTRNELVMRPMPADVAKEKRLKDGLMLGDPFNPFPADDEMLD